MAAKLALTCGDPAGVGPEIIRDWLLGAPAEAPGIVAIGPANWLQTLPANVEGVAVGGDSYAAVAGKPTGEGAQLALAAMELAAQGCATGRFTGVVTGPVSKSELAKVGYRHPGQTEFFAAQWGGEPVMAFCGGRLRLALATWHVPLAEVPQLLGPQLLHRAIAAADELARSEGIETPRIAVCGLNPHAGEDGLLGEEERDFINPSLEKLKREYPALVPRCQPGDTVFARQLRDQFDVVVALYHDQGLGPLKTIDFDEAVNVTLGLPFVRTSPDHGTAFELAGRGVASHRSLANAVKVARRLIQRRNLG